MFNANVFINKAKKYVPQIYSAVFNNESIENCYSKIQEGISVDYGIMEKTNYAELCL